MVSVVADFLIIDFLSVRSEHQNELGIQNYKEEIRKIFSP
jgi:hypothetical protein